MARGRHAGESKVFGDDNYSERKSRSIEEYNNYETNQEYYEDNTYLDDEYEDYDNRRISKKKVFITILIIFLIIEIIFGFRKFLNAKNGNKENIESEEITSLISEVEGYNVLGKIKIDKIGIEQYILNSTEDKALQNGVCKLYGGSLNESGNFCIVGHNFDNIFANLSTLHTDDTFVIIDRNLKETKYKIRKSYSVEPDNLEILLQDKSKVEITLITCEKGSTKRLVIKAEKVD